LRRAYDYWQNQPGCYPNSLGSMAFSLCSSVLGTVVAQTPHVALPNLVHIQLSTAKAASKKVRSEAESHKLNKNVVKMDQNAEATTGTLH